MGGGYRIYVDGCCIRNGQEDARAGIGVFATGPYAMSISEPVKGRATNQEAEIQAATRGLQEAWNCGLTYVKIITDSALVVNANELGWLENWACNGWTKADGGPLRNQKSWRKLYEAINRLVDVEWQHIPGHSGIYGNERADELAREGADMY